MSKRVKGILLHCVLLLCVLIALFPFYWTVVLATNSTVDVYKDPPKLVFGTELLVNIRNMLSNIDFFGSMFNTLIVAVGTTALVLFLDSLAAFTFAKYESPARRRCSDCCCSRSCCRCSSRSSPSSISW